MFVENLLYEKNENARTDISICMKKQCICCQYSMSYGAKSRSEQQGIGAVFRKEALFLPVFFEELRVRLQLFFMLIRFLSYPRRYGNRVVKKALVMFYLPVSAIGSNV